MIQEKLKHLSDEEVMKIGEKLPLYQSEQMLKHETQVINEDLIISMSARISPELKIKLVESVTQIMKGENH